MCVGHSQVQQGSSGHIKFNFKLHKYKQEHHNIHKKRKSLKDAHQFEM